MYGLVWSSDPGFSLMPFTISCSTSTAFHETLCLTSKCLVLSVHSLLHGTVQEINFSCKRKDCFMENELCAEQHSSNTPRLFCLSLWLHHSLTKIQRRSCFTCKEAANTSCMFQVSYCLYKHARQMLYQIELHILSNGISLRVFTKLTHFWQDAQYISRTAELNFRTPLWLRTVDDV